MQKNRKANYDHLIQHKLADILFRESKDPRFKRVTISHVEVKKGVTFAKVYVSVFPTTEVESLIESLNRAAGFFSSRLGMALKTRNTPKLLFVYDKGFDYSVEIEALIQKAKES